MCKIISSDIVIGNFIIDQVGEDISKAKVLTVEKLIAYDRKLSKKLKKGEYYTKFDVSDLTAFQNNYPFFVRKINENTIILSDHANNAAYKLQLMRYFRMGLPNNIIKSMVDASSEV